jgi:hypothetical protein
MPSILVDLKRKGNISSQIELQDISGGELLDILGWFHTFPFSFLPLN